MAAVPYVFFARDMSTTPPGQVLTGLAPSWVFLKKISDGSNVSLPPITEIGHGQYKLAYDPEATGEASGQIDLGAAVANPSDRFIDLVFYLSDSRTTYNLDAAVSSRATPRDLAVTVNPPAPSPLDPAAVAAAIAPLVLVQPPAVTVNTPPVDVAALAAGLGPLIDLPAPVVNPTPVTVPAPAVDVAALAAALAPLLPAPVVVPPPVDLGPVLRELAALEASVAAEPDQSATALLGRLATASAAAKAAYDRALAGGPPIRPPDPTSPLVGPQLGG